jgi:hypothetical protein
MGTGPAAASVTPTDTVAHDAEGLTPEELAMLDRQTGNPLVDLVNGNVPLGNLSTTLARSLLNLIMAVLAAVGFVFLCLSVARRHPRKLAVALPAVLAAAFSLATVIAWVVLEGLIKPVVLLDAYTPFIALLFCASVAALVIYAKARGRLRKTYGEHNPDTSLAAAPALPNTPEIRIAHTVSGG